MIRMIFLVFCVVFVCIFISLGVISKGTLLPLHLILTDMRLYMFLFLIVSCTLSLKSQTKGNVIDGKDNYPLSGVNIYLQKNSVGIGVTDILALQIWRNLSGMIQLFSRMWAIFLLSLLLKTCNIQTIG